MFCRNRCTRLFPDDHDDLETVERGSMISDHITDKDPIQDEDPKGEGSCFFRPRVVFPEDFDRVKRQPLILDPQSLFVGRWNRIFLAVSLFSLFVDPFFLFSTNSNTTELCVESGEASLDVVFTVLRSLTDVLYAVNTCIKFRTAYVAASSRVLGRGELVIDPWDIALRYLGRDFWVDALAVLPIPQVIIWGVIPRVKDLSIKVCLRFLIILPYLLRVALVFPLSSALSRVAGAIPKTAWTGAAYNMMLYYLVSHVVAASWYLLSLQREMTCWSYECDQETSCDNSFFDCGTIGESNRGAWLSITNVTNICNPYNNFFNFGIYQIALQVGAPSSTLARKYFYSFWFGLQTLSSIGNNLWTSANIIENVYTNLLAITGLILFALLLGNVQMYLDSTLLRLEEWRAAKADTEHWMQHRKLPPYLRLWVRKYDQYKWVATRGVDEEALLKDLPWNLRREINRHLCFGLLRKLPLFDEMDDQMLDAVCERLKPALCIKGAFVFRAGDAINKMLFIVRGNLGSYTTSNGQVGLFNWTSIGPGSFCGEELLTWALDPNPAPSLPLSTHMVKAHSDVEAFCLMPEDMKYLAKQFKQLHSKKLVHKFQFYSHHWRTWAAYYIQMAWRRYKKRKRINAM